MNLIRHAPSQPPGHLYGRSDADIGDVAHDIKISLRHMIEPHGAVFSSPAKRCQKTCDTILSPEHIRHSHDELWEQSFGDWDGLAFDRLPDMGQMDDEALVAFAPPNGESFHDLCRRVHPLLTRLCADSETKTLTFFVHAGVIRAALALAFNNSPAALKCQIDTLSLTQLRYLGRDGFSVICVNQVYRP